MLSEMSRPERLIHLERADLTSSFVYLDSRWPNIEIDAPSPNSETKSKDSNSGKPSVDCGSVHKEIFEFKLWKRGNGRECDSLVEPVIERVGKFVNLSVYSILP